MKFTLPIKPRKRFLLILVVLFLGFQIFQRIHGAIKLKKETLESSVPTVAVVHPVSPNPLETVSLPGTIRAWYEAVIYAQESGYVKMWYKDYGAEVEKGDVLAIINVPALDAEYAQAKADLESQNAKYQLANVTANRYLALKDSHAVSEQAISVAVADKNSEEAKLRASQKNLDKFKARIGFKTITSPFRGVVIQRNINVGDYVNKEGNISDSKTPSNLFTVADVHKLRLFVSVPGSLAYMLKPELKASITIPQFSDRKFEANFLTLAKGFDTNTRTVIAEFTIDNPNKLIWPGSYAKVDITAPVKKDVLVIPASALVFDENGTQVATVTSDNKIRFKPIVVSKILNTTVELTSGVDVTDRVVNNPSAALLEGDAVRIVEPRKGYADSISPTFKGKETDENKSEQK